ncbi:MAG: GNAT family N-acetyltransferase, partial [Bacteroidota bacterium]
MSLAVRKGVEQDLPEILELIKELATYERAPQEVENTVDLMREHGFGEVPIFGFEVAEKDNKIIGTAIYYTKYSTWKGKKLHLEDLIITESERGQKAGKALFERCLEIAKEQKCYALEWQVLDWNEPAINFYKRYQSEFDPEWIDCS